jgi:hypothetical protein
MRLETKRNAALSRGDCQHDGRILMEPATTAEVFRHVTLPSYGLGAAALVLFVLLPAVAILGLLTGRSNRQRRIASGKEVDLRAGEASLGAIMALLGLLLAFSFGSALSLLESRKLDVIAEANALSKAFLRADYLPEPSRSALKDALHEYAQTRLVPETGGLVSTEDASFFIERSLAAQDRLWPLTVDATDEPLPPAIATFVAGAVNDVLDAHQMRMRSISIPVAERSQIIVVVTALAALFLLGNRAGIAGRTLTWRTFTFAALLFVVMMTVLDLQRGSQGFIRVDQRALRATLADMEARLR